MVRRRAELELLIVHPGGPFFAKKDDGAWTIPKGLVEVGEEDLVAAQRELTEETGLVAIPPFVPLGEVTQKAGKIVVAFAFEGDCDPHVLDFSRSTFELEWPPRSGRKQRFTEIDRAGFFTPEIAKVKLNDAQRAFVDRAVAHFSIDSRS